MKCPKGTWIDEPNEAEGEKGIIEQKTRYCPNCMYQIEINEEWESKSTKTTIPLSLVNPAVRN